MPATIPTPATKQLAKAVRDAAVKVAPDDAPDRVEAIDAAELLRCFARLLEGKTLDEAMGAPGDWGYGTPIGDATHALIKEPGFPPRLLIPEADAKNEG